MKYILMGFSITCLIFILFQPKASAVKFEENKHKQKTNEYSKLQVISVEKSLDVAERTEKKERLDSVGKWRDKNMENSKNKNLNQSFQKESSKRD